ncbi:MAG TPA: TIGR03790 family protein [Verrucomicrobiae bacterium]|nr:TIGR03790 family protein [Verrucomicrobiae bacterium]
MKSCLPASLTLWTTRIRRLGLIGLLLPSAGSNLQAGGGPQNVLLVVNGQSQSSLAIANAYQQLRAIPEGNILYLPSSNTAPLYTTGASADLRRNLNSGLFRTNVLWPTLNYIRSRGLTNQIDYIVYSSDIPTIINATSESNATLGVSGAAYFSLTAMTAYSDLIEPMNTASNMSSSMLCFRGTSRTASPDTWTTNLTHAANWGAAGRSYYMSAVLGWTDAMGSTIEDATNMLARSLSADGTRPTGTVYMDANKDIRGTTRSWQFSSTATELTGLGITSEILTTNPSPYSISNKTNVLGAMMGAALPYVPAGSYYLPGSIAESLTSWSGIMDYSGIGQFRLTQHSAVGVAGTSGTVTEPFAISSKFPAARMHAHYARGCTMGEAFYQSVQQPYHLLIMGDPLCRPHAIIPQVTVTGLLDGSVISGTFNVTPEATTAHTNGIASLALFLDGLPFQEAPVGGPFTIDTTQLADGWHTALFVAYENSVIRTQGDLLRHFHVNNLGEQILVTPESQSVLAGGTASLTVTPGGGTATSVEIWKGPQRLATLGAAGGTTNLSASLLGPGRSILRAVANMDSGEVRSAPVTIDVASPPDTSPPTVERFYVLTGTNSDIASMLTNKPANKAGDWIFLHMVPSEPVSLVDQEFIITGRSNLCLPLKWNGLSSTNKIPSLMTSTNPAIWRYQVNESFDPEGQMPIVIRLTDGVGNRSVVTNFVATDYTPPAVTQLWASSHIVLPNQGLRLHFWASENLMANPTVSVAAGGNAVFQSLTDNRYAYSYVVPSGAASGWASVSFTNVLDSAGNPYSTMIEPCDFETMALGQNLTNDSRWSGPTGSTYKPTAFVTNSPTPGGSTKSVIFRDEAASMSQIYGFKLPTRRRFGTVAFDASLADRNPSGTAELRVFLSQGTTSRSEVQLALSQTDSSTWRVGIRGPSGTTYYTNNLPLQSWHRIQFMQDMGLNICSLSVDGVALATAVPYTSTYTNLPWADTFNFTNSGNDEDSLIDNVLVSDVLDYIRVSPDTDADGIPDLWEEQVFGGLGAADAGSDADHDGLSDCDEWRTGSDPLDARSRLRGIVVSGPSAGNGPTFRFQTSPGQTYLLQKSANLRDPWTDVGEYFSPSEELTITVPPSADAAAFWRLRWVP